MPRVLGAAVVATGLLAGLFYAFACAVIPGLSDSDDRTFIDAMQQINKAIENPVFFLTFLGAPALTIWALVIERRAGSRRSVRWVAAALVRYGVGFVVTFAVNIPLNDDLERTGNLDDFEGPWVAWNIVRTVAVTACFCALVHAFFLHARDER